MKVYKQCPMKTKGRNAISAKFCVSAWIWKTFI